MNLVLIDAADLVAPDVAELRGRRYEHLTQVLKLTERDHSCRVGMLNGAIGTGRVIGSDAAAGVLQLQFTLDAPPPPPAGIKLVVALQRPLTGRKVLHAAVTMGVKELWFFQSKKVDKGYWSNPWFSKPGALGEDLRLALEQCVDTVMPRVGFHRRFKFFVEDYLPGIAAGTRLLLAHPGGGVPCPHQVAGPVTLLVGPEGGFTDYEVAMFRELGAEEVELGARILRSEVAVPVLLSKLKD